jgi:hypothetical protein
MLGLSDTFKRNVMDIAIVARASDVASSEKPVTLRCA